MTFSHQGHEVGLPAVSRARSARRPLEGSVAASIAEKVPDIVCDQLGVPREKVTPETSFINDLGADSLDTVELVMELEEEFDISIPDEDAEKIQTVGEAIKYIEEHINQ